MQKIIVNMERVAKQIVPNLENLHIYPSNIEQIFTHENSNGYDIVTVAPIGDILTTTSVKSSEYQLIVDPQEPFIGFSQVIVEPIVLQDKEITPTKDIQVVSYDENYDGLNEITINAIPSEFIDPQGEIEITENGEYNVREYSDAIIDVKPILQEKNVEIDINSSIDIVADDEYDGLSKVIVSNTQELEQKEITPTKETQVILPSENKLIDQVTINPIPNNYIDPSGEQEITENGTYNVREIESVNVKIQPNLGTKTITENGVYNASDDGLDGYSSVEVETSGADLNEVFGNPSNFEGTVSNVGKWIESIKKLPAFDTTDVTSMNYLYSEFTGNNIDLSGIDTSNVTNMSRMFSGCKGLTNLDLTKFITDKLTIMEYMFYRCSNLTNLDLSSFNVENVTSMGYAFMSCTNLTHLNLSNFVTTSLTNTTQMFAQCRNLKYIDMRNFDFTNVIIHSNMFGQYATNGIPDDCEIIVKDDTAKEWITSRFSRLTNVKTVSELENN